MWSEQFHTLHGPDTTGASWRRTVVAADDNDDLIGCASIANNLVHPDRFPCAIEVIPNHRRRGIGTALLSATRQMRPFNAPLSTKVRVSDQAAQGFFSRVGGRRYQQCTAAVIDPRNPTVQRWAARRHATACTDLSEQTIPQLADAFMRQYLWVHKSWSPVGDRAALAAIANDEVAVLDRKASSARWVDGRLAAIGFAFKSVRGFEVVAETVEREEPDGIALVADVVGDVCAKAAAWGEMLEFDGHITDPNLHPVLVALPHHQENPLDLVELS